MLYSFVLFSCTHLLYSFVYCTSLLSWFCCLTLMYHYRVLLSYHTYLSSFISLICITHMSYSHVLPTCSYSLVLLTCLYDLSHTIVLLACLSLHLTVVLNVLFLTFLFHFLALLVLAYTAYLLALFTGLNKSSSIFKCYMAPSSK